MNLVLAATTATVVVLIVCAALLLAAFFWGFNRWTNDRRVESERRPSPVEPSGLSEAILHDFVLKLRQRDEHALSAEVARDDLRRVA